MITASEVLFINRYNVSNASEKNEQKSISSFIYMVLFYFSSALHFGTFHMAWFTVVKFLAIWQMFSK